jgi:hypothetical protein
MCEIDGCERDINRDGLCFAHKIKTVRTNIADLRRENKGEGVSGSDGTEKYVRSMYETRRSQGLPDPVPENAEAAKFAPAIGVHGGKEYRKVNGGL